MRPKSMILIVIALGCGLIASIGISQVMESQVTEQPIVTPMEQIYVATTDVPLGQTLSPQMVKLEEWPQDKIPEGAVRSLEQLEGQRSLTRLYPGEPIMMAKLIDANKFFGAAEKIPKGFRVASVRVTMDSSASGLINPGDRVDVLVFLKRGAGITSTGTRTILKNVTVFAVNDRFQRDPEEEGEGGLRAKTVSVLVKPNQVEKLMLAQELGRIKLSLRPTDDDSDDQANGATIADLDSESADSGSGFSIAEAVGEPSAGGITDFLNGMKADLESVADISSQTSATIPRQAWVMHIHTPDRVEVFNWDDPESLPRELLSSGSARVPAEFSTAPVSAPATPLPAGESALSSDESSSRDDFSSAEGVESDQSSASDLLN
jgi:pilus assembly protein CpaB